MEGTQNYPGLIDTYDKNLSRGRVLIKESSSSTGSGNTSSGGGSGVDAVSRASGV
jgi:hypothetical protein